MVKNYLLDTNIILSNPQSIFGFEDNNVYLCGTTLQELDSKKSAPGEVGYNAREACRILDGLRVKGNLIKGVPLETGGKLIIEPDGVKAELLPEGFSLSIPDNRIMSTCLYLNSTKLQKSHIILLTNDISMRVNATILGLKVQGVLNDVVEDKGYTGHEEIKATDKAIRTIREAGKEGAASSLIKGSFVENEYLTLKGRTEQMLAVYRKGIIREVKPQKLYGDVTPRNRMQIFAMHALMAPVEEIPLVIMEGPAGTAKTFLTLAAGLSQTNLGNGMVGGQYDKMLISKPNSGSTDPSFGFLPGSLEDKMAPMLANYYDNLESLMRGQGGRYESHESVQMMVEDLFESGVIELCPLYAIRGRTLFKSFLILDEAQNASKGLIRDVITRAGEGSKVVVMGDPKQIDVPTLSKYTNGLQYCKQTMFSSDLTAVIQYTEEDCVRSPLSETAIRQMK